MSTKCGKCGKTVYANEVQKGIGRSYHKLCFKCEFCNAKIEPGSECDKGGKLACKKCGFATEGFRGAAMADAASFKATGDVRVTGGTAKGADSASPRAASGGSGGAGPRFCAGCGGARTGANEAFCSNCGKAF